MFQIPSRESESRLQPRSPAPEAGNDAGNSQRMNNRRLTTPSRSTHVTLVVIGGGGLIGAKDMKTLTGQGHEAIAASPSTGCIP
jgi:hypothetical protein